MYTLTTWWLDARLWYLWCISSGDMAVFNQAIALIFVYFTNGVLINYLYMISENVIYFSTCVLLCLVIPVKLYYGCTCIAMSEIFVFRNNVVLKPSCIHMQVIQHFSWNMLIVLVCFVCFDFNASMDKTRAPSQYKDRLIYVWRFPC